jgi:hypothetical protein
VVTKVIAKYSKRLLQAHEWVAQSVVLTIPAYGFKDWEVTCPTLCTGFLVLLQVCRL